MKGYRCQGIDAECHLRLCLRNGNRVCHRLDLDDGIVLLGDDRFRQVEFHLVGHATLQWLAQLVVSDDSPLRMLQSQHLGASRNIQPDFAYLILALHDAKRCGESEVGRGFYLDKGTSLVVEVAYMMDEGTHIVG